MCVYTYEYIRVPKLVFGVTGQLGHHSLACVFEIKITPSGLVAAPLPTELSRWLPSLICILCWPETLIFLFPPLMLGLKVCTTVSDGIRIILEFLISCLVKFWRISLSLLVFYIELTMQNPPVSP